MEYLKEKPYFDEEENFYIPMSIKPCGEMDPPIKPKEWFYLVLTQSKSISQKRINHYLNILCGSRSTQWRIKKSLKNKGYL